MGTFYIDEQGASRLYQSDETGGTVDDGDFIDWDVGDKFIVCVQVGNRILAAAACNKDAVDDSQILLQYEEDGVGGWVDVANGGPHQLFHNQGNNNHWSGFIYTGNWCKDVS